MEASTESKWSLVFEGLADESDETLQRLKGIFIADLELSIPEVQEVLGGTRTVILEANSMDLLSPAHDTLMKAGAKVKLVAPVSAGEEAVDEGILEIPALDELDSSPSSIATEPPSLSEESSDVSDELGYDLSLLGFGDEDGVEKAEAAPPKEEAPRESGDSLEEFDLNKSLEISDVLESIAEESDGTASDAGAMPLFSGIDPLTGKTTKTGEPSDSDNEEKEPLRKERSLSDELVHFDMETPTAPPKKEKESEELTHEPLFAFDEESDEASPAPKPPKVTPVASSSKTSDTGFDLTLQEAPEEEPLLETQYPEEEEGEDDAAEFSPVEEPDLFPLAPDEELSTASDEVTESPTDEAQQTLTDPTPVPPSLQTEKQSSTEKVEESAKTSKAREREETEELDIDRPLSEMKRRESTSETEDEEEFESEEEYVPAPPAAAKKFDSELLLYLLGGLVFLAGANFLYFQLLAPTPPAPSVATLSPEQRKALKAKKLAKQQAALAEGAVIELTASPLEFETDDGLKVFGTLEWHGSELAAVTDIDITAPEPPELTKREIVRNVERAPWLHRLEVATVPVHGNAPKGGREGSSTGRIYLEQFGIRNRRAASVDIAVRKLEAPAKEKVTEDVPPSEAEMKKKEATKSPSEPKFVLTFTSKEGLKLSSLKKNETFKALRTGDKEYAWAINAEVVVSPPGKESLKSDGETKGDEAGE